MSVPGPQAGPDMKGDVLVCLGFGGETQLSPQPSSTLFRKPRASGPLGRLTALFYPQVPPRPPVPSRPYLLEPALS